jgi:thiopurine S-methyltransferase
MEATFWRERWATHKIGFHEGRPNAFLAQYIARLDGRYRVLVPLCGKSEDLAFLAANGHAVVGIELVEDAVVQFFAEHALTPKVERRGEHAIYTAHEITVIAGDFFTVTPELVGQVDAVYDRAALIAMPPEMRPAYLAQVRTLTKPAAWGLVITLDYPAGAFEGPPFAVSDAEVRSAYVAAELVAEAPNRSGRIAETGVVAVERCYSVQITA